MVARVQNAHKSTVGCFETLKRSGKSDVRVDPSLLLRLMTTEFGGSSDFVTSIGPDDASSCSTAALRNIPARTSTTAPTGRTLEVGNRPFRE
eukprot:5804885-Amphidinium_carterae.1